MQTDVSHLGLADAAGGRRWLWRYPVKSMMGEELNATEVTERGSSAIDSSPLSTRRPEGSRAPRTRASGEFFDFRAAYTEPLQRGSKLPRSA